MTFTGLQHYFELTYRAWQPFSIECFVAGSHVLSRLHSFLQQKVGSSEYNLFF